MNTNNIFRCNICNKKYSSKNSLCNYNKKYNNNITQNILNYTTNIPQKTTIIPQLYHNYI